MTPARLGVRQSGVEQGQPGPDGTGHRPGAAELLRQLPVVQQSGQPRPSLQRSGGEGGQGGGVRLGGPQPRDEQMVPEHLPHPAGLGGEEGLVHLRPHPLHRQIGGGGGVCQDGFHRRMEGKAQLGDQPQGPKHPQPVLPEAAGGVAHAPQHPGIKVS